jgi:hypothetical protein
MTEEPIEPTDEELGIFDASPLGQDVAAHYAALKLVDRLTANKAFAIPKDGFSLKVLRELAEDFSTAAKPLVVFEHETVYEVRMLEKGQNPKRFYSYVGNHGEAAVNLQSLDEEAQERVLDCIREIFLLPSETNAKYEPKFTPEWNEHSVFSYSLIHRKLAAIVLFRKAKRGATFEIKKALANLIEADMIHEVPPAIAMSSYGTGGQLFKLQVKGRLK